MSAYQGALHRCRVLASRFGLGARRSQGRAVSASDGANHDWPDELVVPPPCKPVGAVVLGIVSANAECGSDRIVPISRKNGVSSGNTPCNSGRRWVLPWRHICSLRSRALPGTRTAPASRGTAIRSAGTWPRWVRNGGHASLGCHLIVILVFLHGAKLGPLRFPALSLFAQRLRLSKVKRLSLSSEIPAVHNPGR